MSALFANQVVRASAGSGKTFQLSNRYLKLVLCGASVDSILATTFTRKAAGEIQDRILSRLGLAAAHSHEAERLFHALCDADPEFEQKSGLTIQNAQTIFQQKLEEVVQELNRLRICTLDSFFMQISGGYAFEVGLPPNWHIVEEVEIRRLQHSALLTSFVKADPKHAVTLSRMLFKGEYNRTIEAQISDIITNSLGIYYATTPKAWTRIDEGLNPNLPNLDALLNALKQAQEELKQDVDKKIVDKRAVAAIEKLYGYAEAQNWTEFTSHGFLKKVQKGENYYSKPIPDYVATSLFNLFDYARQQNFVDISAQLHAAWGALHVVSNFFNIAKKENGAYRFDDLTRLLVNLELGNQLKKIVYRLNASVSHILLDEFQDASFEQWAIVKPFVTSVVNERSNGSFFCVGDVKQAIYAWRGGKAEIFDTIEQDVPRVANSSMATNWRSCGIIIDVVNKLFRGIKENEAFNLRDDSENELKNAIRKGVARWSAGFEEHRAAKQNLSGFFTLEQAPKVDDSGRIPPLTSLVDAGEPWAAAPNDLSQTLVFIDENEKDEDGEESPESSSASSKSKLQKQATLAYTVERIYQLRKQYPLASIGVLPRTNKYIAKLTARLKERFRGEEIEISEEGGTPLADSPAVNAVLSTLQLASHTCDSIARFHVANIEPLSKRLDITVEDYDKPFKAQNVSRYVRKLLETHGLGDFVSQLRAIVAPICDNPRDKERLDKLVEYAYSFQTKADHEDVDQFIQAIRDMKIESPSAATLRVMSLHKSKGLEFDIVVLPELDAQIDRIRATDLFVHRNSPKAPIDAVVKYVPRDRLVNLPPSLDKWLPETFNEKTAGDIQEALNLLYVGVTRPVQGLVAIVAPQPTKSKTLTYAKILREGLASGYVVESDQWANDPRPQILFRAGDVNCEIGKQLQRKKEAQEQELSLIQHESKPGTFDKRLLMRRKTPTGDRESFAWTPESAFQEGTAIHACFERIRWLDVDGAPTDEELENVLRPILLDRAKTQQVLGRFKKICNLDFTQKLLSQSSYAGYDTQVYRERPFSYMEGKDSLIRGTIDRLVLKYQDDQLVGADIIDFKSDKYASKETINEYRLQLNEYGKVVAKQFKLSKDRITLRLAFVSEDWPEEERNYIIQ
ncbi:MAG: UvrD-helicase domain-containing protein [Thermoguttaceae bacterium]|nr:UvrD-helicase domain-containing protein [Thermoguttaceae bacterium]